MSAVIVLDSTPLGILAHPRNPPHAIACRNWLESLALAGRRIVLPEIADYEIRRELLRIQSQQALSNLDKLVAKLDYLPLNSAMMRSAAQIWAQARNTGQQTASNQSLDADVILAAREQTSRGRSGRGAK